MFRAEAEILAALAGRGAPRLLRSGEDGAGPWLWMERVAWPVLGTRLHTRPSPAWVARACGSAFEALAAVHEARDEGGLPLSILHADLSPANVAVADDGQAAALLDFGLAVGRRWSRAGGGEFRGSILYAAPEVARAGSFDARADLHALAASLLHVASGEAPRAAAGLAAAIAEAAEVPLGVWAARAAQALPEAARAALVRCVAFDPAERPATARDVARAAGR